MTELERRPAANRRERDKNVIEITNPTYVRLRDMKFSRSDELKRPVTYAEVVERLLDEHDAVAAVAAARAAGQEGEP